MTAASQGRVAQRFPKGALALWNVKVCALTAGDRERAKQGTLGPPKASEFRQTL